MTCPRSPPPAPAGRPAASPTGSMRRRTSDKVLFYLTRNARFSLTFAPSSANWPPSRGPQRPRLLFQEVQAHEGADEDHAVGEAARGREEMASDRCRRAGGRAARLDRRQHPERHAGEEPETDDVASMHRKNKLGA